MKTIKPFFAKSYAGFRLYSDFQFVIQMTAYKLRLFRAIEIAVMPQEP